MTRRGGALLALTLAACTASGSPSVSPEPTPGPNPTAGSPPPSSAEAPAPVVLAAGDIAACDSNGDESTAALLDGLQGTILALGDLVYESGTTDEFANCYDPSWGRHRGRTLPAPGNHEYETANASAYFAYFGAMVGEPGQGWYEVELGTWHVIALNSNCEAVGGCDPGSPQAQWLRESLAALSPGPGCTLAYWHHPRWSSGHAHGSDPLADTFWRLLYDAGVDLVLTAHDHQYERFVPMDADGAADPNGMVEFVVGTGGRSLYDFGAILPTGAAHDNSTFGVLQLTLHPGRYDWQFIPASATGFTDAGSAGCR